MGDVHRARDTKLKREVAIKVLPEEFSRDPERLRRFRREAEVLATLNHPHIAQIYGLEEDGGTLCLVLELVEGETLAERIQRGAIPVEEAMRLAIQITEALEAAGVRGVVHRDLKPANIKITPEGHLKVLDFGLAKATAGEPSDVSASQSPTLVSGTMPGVIMGTAAYMSPEQAKGSGADARSDIWSFGCVLYEMLTGKRAFGGDDVIEILSCILKSEPDWTALPSRTSGTVCTIIKHCLQKDRNRRLQVIGDARFHLEEALRSPVNESPTAAPARKSRERLWWMAVLLVLIVALAANNLYFRGSQSDPPEMRLEIVTPPADNSMSFALSPDGRKLVFQANTTGKSQLWLRKLDSETAQPLAGTDATSIAPFWSPESESIGFTAADGQLKRIDIASGLVRALTAGALYGGAWSKAGVVLFARTDTGPLRRVPASGGEAVEATRTDPPRVTGHWMPFFLPDGRHFVFWGWGSPENKGIYLGSLDSMETHRLFDADARAVFAPPDLIVFPRQKALMAQRLDMKTFQLVGDPVTVAPRVYTFSFEAAISASAAGPIAYRADGPETQSVWLDRSGREIGAVGLPDAARESSFTLMRLSPDGRTIALIRHPATWEDVWLIDASTGVPQPFTSGISNKFNPIWSPKGDRIVFSWDPKGVLDLYEKPLGASGNGTVLWSSPEHKWTMDWSSDGKFILYRSNSQKTGYDLWALPYSASSNDRKPIEVARESFDEDNGRFSPDGRWIVYQSNETGRNEIFVQPFPGNSASRKLITRDGGLMPQWRGDGREIFYLSLDNRLMAVSVDLSSGAPVPGNPTTLFPLPPQSDYAVSRDGQRFLINKTVKDAAPITILLNWKPK